MADRRKLEMTISLNALEHLGMNLYSGGDPTGDRHG